MRFFAFITFLLAWTAGSAYADGIGNEDQPAYERCAACHGLDGISHMPKFPKLAGQNPAYIVKQLEDFLHGRRANDGGQMATAATEITDDERLEVARYFSELPPAPQVAEPDSLAVRGRELFEKPGLIADIPACIACHSSTALSDKSSEPAVPVLRGQHRSYTAKQLHDFKSGHRANDTDGIMRRLAGHLSDEDIEALSSFLETAEPNH